MLTTEVEMAAPQPNPRDMVLFGIDEELLALRADLRRQQEENSLAIQEIQRLGSIEAKNRTLQQELQKAQADIRELKTAIDFLMQSQAVTPRMRTNREA